MLRRLFAASVQLGDATVSVNGSSWTEQSIVIVARAVAKTRSISSERLLTLEQTCNDKTVLQHAAKQKHCVIVALLKVKANELTSGRRIKVTDSIAYVCIGNYLLQ
jgi:hypothetical protein